MLLQDLRFALRSFLRAPRFTVPAIVALALGIGATSAIFSIVRGVILKPLPYRDPERIVAIWEHRVDRNRPRNVIASANFVAWRERNTSFEFLGMVQPSTTEPDPERATGRGRRLPGLERRIGGVRHGTATWPAVYASRRCPGSDRVMVVSHRFWQSRLGGRSDVLGMSVTTNFQTRTVIGVMPPDFTIEGVAAAYLIPFGFTDQQMRESAGRGAVARHGQV